jgi:hypothetical protein
MIFSVVKSFSISLNLSFLSNSSSFFFKEFRVSAFTLKYNKFHHIVEKINIVRETRKCLMTEQKYFTKWHIKIFLAKSYLNRIIKKLVYQFRSKYGNQYAYTLFGNNHQRTVLN